MMKEAYKYFGFMAKASNIRMVRIYVCNESRIVNVELTLEIGNKCSRSVARWQNQPTAKTGDEDDVVVVVVCHLRVGIIREFKTRDAVQLQDRGMSFRQVFVSSSIWYVYLFVVIRGEWLWTAGRKRKGTRHPGKNENFAFFHLFFNIAVPSPSCVISGQKVAKSGGIQHRLRSSRGFHRADSISSASGSSGYRTQCFLLWY